MGYGDVMPLSMLQHVQKNLEDYRNNGKKTKKTGDDFEERLNVGKATSEWVAWGVALPRD